MVEIKTDALPEWAPTKPFWLSKGIMGPAVAALALKLSFRYDDYLIYCQNLYVCQSLQRDLASSLLAVT